MSSNMSQLDRRLRSFLVAPIAVLVAVLAGAGSVGGIALFALATVMLATSAVGLFGDLGHDSPLTMRYRRQLAASLY